MYPQEFLSEVLEQWDLNLARVCPKHEIQGSPERTDFRVVVEVEDGEQFVLEQVSSFVRARKQNIAEVLAQLDERGMSRVLPCRKNRAGEFLTKRFGGFWQIVPFCDGVELNRPDYLKDAWRGKALADFLIALRGVSGGLPVDEQETAFSLRDYILDFLKQLERHNPELFDPIRPAFELLEKELFPVWDTIPSCFCHGDIHPVNVIWGAQEARAVIDWEFMGRKKEIYDAANLLGCLGMEHPSGLQGNMALAFLARVRESGLYSPQSLNQLPVFVLAQRFPWLAEWLRKRDREMVDLEITYINLIRDNIDVLKDAWFGQKSPSGVKSALKY